MNWHHITDTLTLRRQDSASGLNPLVLGQLYDIRNIWRCVAEVTKKSIISRNPWYFLSFRREKLLVNVQTATNAFQITYPKTNAYTHKVNKNSPGPRPRTIGLSEKFCACVSCELISSIVVSAATNTGSSSRRSDVPILNDPYFLVYLEGREDRGTSR